MERLSFGIRHRYYDCSASQPSSPGGSTFAASATRRAQPPDGPVPRPERARTTNPELAFPEGDLGANCKPTAEGEADDPTTS
jgi:hypothetical protein